MIVAALVAPQVVLAQAAAAPALTKVIATPATIMEGGSSTLSWTPRSDVTAVLVSGGGLDEVEATGDNSHVVTPTETTTYTLSAQDEEGAPLPGNFKVTVTVTAAPSAPALTKVIATPATIMEGGSSTLSWTPRSDVTAVLVSGGGLDEVEATGDNSHVVTPTETTTYTLSAQDEEGAPLPGNFKVTVTVTAAPSGLALTKVIATPATIMEGGSSTLSWTPRSDVTAVLVSGGGLDEVEATGDNSHVVTPTETTTYTLSAQDEEGAPLPGNFKVTVTVTAAPSAPALTKVIATPATIMEGGSSTLSWTPRSDVTAVLVSGGGLDEVEATGDNSHVVTPTETTTYTLSAQDEEGAPLPGNFKVTVTVTAAPSGLALTKVIATPATIMEGGSSTLSWTPRSDVTAVLVSGGGLDEVEATGDNSHVVTPTETTTYTLSAQDEEGAPLGDFSVVVTVTAAPSGLALTKVIATPATIMEGGSSTLSWTPRSDVTAVLVSGGGLDEVEATGDNSHVVTPTETTTYTLSAQDEEGAPLPGNFKVTVTVTAAPSGLALTKVIATPATIMEGGSSTLSWTPRSDVTAVLVSGGGLDEVEATGDNSHVVTPTETTTYTLSAQDEEGAPLPGNFKVTVTVTAAPSGLALTKVIATPATIMEGGSSTLSWTPRSDVTAVLVSGGGLDEVEATGDNSHVVTPTETTTYTLSAQDEEGAPLPGNFKVTVTVTAAPSGLALTKVIATPATIMEGGSSTLSWTPRSDVTAVLVSGGGLDEVEATGDNSHVVTPTETTTYTLSAQDEEGAPLPGNFKVTVTVTAAPSGLALTKVIATPATIMEGGSSTLSWTPRSDVTAVLVSGGGLDEVEATGGNSHVVTPTETTTYTLSAQDEEGAPLGDFSVVVTVTAAPSGLALTKVIATPATIMEGGSSTLSWTPRSDVTAVLVSGGGLDEVEATGDNSHVVTPTETTTYTLSAQDEEGAPLGDFSVVVTVTAAPSGLALTKVIATPATIMEGGSSTLSWTPRSDVTAVLVSGGGLDEVEATGDNSHVVTPTETTTYTLSAQDEEGAPLGDFSVVVTVTAAPSGLALTKVIATPATIMEGGSSTLSWTPRSDVTAVLVSGGGLDEVEATGGNSHVVTPTETTTYTLSAQDEEGAPLGDFSVVVTVTAAPSGLALTKVIATPATIMEGGSSTLSWTPRSDVTAVLVSGGGLDEVEATGGNSHVVTPTETTTYTLSAQDEEGAPLGDFSVVVTVTAAPSGLALTKVIATPATIMEGGSSTLSWTPRSDVTAVLVSGGGLDEVEATGDNSHVVTPTETTTYTLSAQDEEGAPLGDFSVVVTVTAAPSGLALTKVIATPATIMEGGSSTLSWTPRSDVTAVLVSGGGLDEVEATGGNSHVVTPTETTTYTLSAQDEEGAPLGDFSVVVTVTADFKDILPELARSMVSSTVEAVASRIQSAQSGSTMPAQSFNLAGNENIALALQATEKALKEGRWQKALNHSSFMLRLNEGTSASGGISAWGSGTLHGLSNNSASSPWDGDVFSTHFGVDTRVSGDTLAGVAVSWSRGDFKVGTDDTLESRMTSLYPYVGWVSEDHMGLWATLGYGWGENTYSTGASDTSLQAVAVGGHAQMWSDDSVIAGGTTTVTLKGEAWSASLKTEGNETILPQETDVQSLRLRIAGDHTRALAGEATMVSSLEAGVRSDSGDGETGTAAELGGGLTWTDQDLTVRGFARMQLSDRGGVEEWGIGGMVGMTAGTDKLGLSFHLRPSWGEAVSELNTLWKQGLTLRDRDAYVPVAKLDAEIGYGVPVQGGVLTPYSGMALSDDGARNYRIGGRLELDQSWVMSVEGNHQQKATGGTDHGLMLKASVNW